jgi:hypothetical protein
MDKKRILRLMREHHLLVVPNRHQKAKRTPTGRKPHLPAPDLNGNFRGRALNLPKRFAGPDHLLCAFHYVL